MSFFDDHNDQLPADFEDNGHWANHTALKRRVRRETMRAIADLYAVPPLPTLPEKQLFTLDELTPAERIERDRRIAEQMAQHEKMWAERDDYRHV